ncbi:MAG: LysR family transcriptional regulator [Polyangiaceae bacterium]|nr:LysR family transcriptional regulator [Polyangiaceae bacterium]
MFDELFRERGLSLERLQAFVAVADAGSITKASRGDPVRQSQLSRQLSELESFFGRALTEKQRGRRVLSADGARLAEHVRFSLSGLLDFKRGRPDGGVAPLTLAAGDSILSWLVIPRIARVPARFAVVALPAHDVVSALLEGRVDLGIVRRDAKVKALESRPVGKIEHALFVPRAIVPRGVVEADVAFRVPLAVQVADRDFMTAASVAARKRGEPLDVRLSCETFNHVLSAVKSGRFAGLLPTFARAELPKVRFREVVFPSRHASAIALAWSPALLRARPAVRDTIDKLAEVLQSSN